MSTNAPQNPAPVERPPFRAVLTPHRSLSRSGFLAVMVAVSLVSFVAGLVFLLMGAWPVFAFFGLDVVLIYVAFRLNYRDGRAFETVELTADRLTLTRVDGKGRSEQAELNPYWVKVELVEAPDGRNDLRLTMRDRALPLGRFLTNEERQELADALRGELSALRGGVRV